MARLPSYSIFLNLGEEWFSVLRWKGVGYEHQNVSAWCNECWLWWHHINTLQRAVAACKIFSPPLHHKGKYQVWYPWKSVAWQTGVTRHSVKRSIYCSTPSVLTILILKVAGPKQHQIQRNCILCQCPTPFRSLFPVIRSLL